MMDTLVHVRSEYLTYANAMLRELDGPGYQPGEDPPPAPLPYLVRYKDWDRSFTSEPEGRVGLYRYGIWVSVADAPPFRLLVDLLDFEGYPYAIEACGSLVVVADRRGEGDVEDVEYVVARHCANCIRPVDRNCGPIGEEFNFS